MNKAADIESHGLVLSSQAGIHPGLMKTLERHFARQWRQPLHKPSVGIFEHLWQEGILAGSQKVVLDSGCGTGHSSFQLATQFADSLVIGVDRSEVRLGKSGVRSGWRLVNNCLLIRSELSTFWRLLLKAKIAVENHYLLYPNPWPKAQHLKRRWHGHPVFPVLIKLGGKVEMRCNWLTYAQEFAMAAGYATGQDIRETLIQPDLALSRFEQKYLDRGHDLYAVTFNA